jgi:hypothetical protein
MSVRHQNGVRFYREMTESIVDARSVWLNTRPERYAQKIYPREVRINQQSVSFEFELVTIRAQISHTHTAARRRARIVHHELRVVIKSGTKRWSREYEPQKNSRAPRTMSTARIENRQPQLAFSSAIG